ncbi:MAG: pyrimidine reductase family protein [Acidimicrobiia bacterium]
MRLLSSKNPLADPLAPYADVDRHLVDGRPWVLANMVSGLDGSTAIDGRVGALSSPTDRQLFVDLRSVADVVLVGAETVRRERYGPVVLSPERRRQRADRGRPTLPRLAVVSRSLGFDLDAQLFRPGPDGSPPIVVTCEASSSDARARLSELAEVIVAGADRVEPLLALQALAEAGHQVVLCEGGPSLLGELLAQDLIDELCLTLAPIVGGDPLPVAVMPPTAATSDFRLGHVLEADGNLFLRYERR